jgi:hypothetical protein
MEVQNGLVSTYKNKNGDPIIRKCGNCKYWNGMSGDNGYCKMLPLLFAYSLESSMFAITPKFTLCEKHVLRNEEILQTQSETVAYDVEYMKNHSNGAK